MSESLSWDDGKVKVPLHKKQESVNDKDDASSSLLARARKQEKSENK